MALTKATKRWTAEEDQLFSALLDLYCRDFQAISEQMNKSYNQVRSHYYNLEKKHQMQKLRTKYVESQTDDSNKDKKDAYQFIVFDSVK
ncbi:SANT/Myb_domain [Hexamita inflata]|uniref:SANT/Myb domain n=2 Tax=Hexamita inflata TaxID=28002 RepID=A0AA86PJ23_9EUKA|nr:SANT/Myb domain [Hexamita inflata]